MTQQIKDGRGEAQAEDQLRRGREIRVRVIDRPFANFSGFVDEVMPEKEKLRVMVQVFGRATPSCSTTRTSRRPEERVGGQEGHRNGDQAAVPRGAGEPVAAGGARAGPARRQHHGVLQGVQRAHAGQAGPDHSGR